jgi:hypothetical protein
LPIRRQEFGRGAECDVRRGFVRGGVDGGDRHAIPAGIKNLLAEGVVGHAVGIFHDGNLRDGLEGDRVEGDGKAVGRGIGPNIPCGWVDGDAMAAGQGGKRADDFIGFGVKHVHVVAMGDEQAVGGCVEMQVVPMRWVAERDGGDEMVGEEGFHTCPLGAKVFLVLFLQKKNGLTS